MPPAISLPISATSTGMMLSLPDIINWDLGLWVNWSNFFHPWWCLYLSLPISKVQNVDRRTWEGVPINLHRLLVIFNLDPALLNSSITDWIYWQNTMNSFVLWDVELCYLQLSTPQLMGCYGSEKVGFVFPLARSQISDRFCWYKTVFFCVGLHPRARHRFLVPSPLCQPDIRLIFGIRAPRVPYGSRW